ncbi:outer membrane lipoprotein chaperone LolA [Shewanella submarina]|uniref:Outer-membrane lipoprotein carrier protein n=1 Tax=Shewanella submarina TaxID=2016376 RepID=A0ABV7GDP7_9GAMM|nr:outer membrane lipoprotein chaperone LolA [Shewanella submarina]MCL1037916.1 outer membrane lipoprotein chaperone LolA [Shewanella submarina]
MKKRVSFSLVAMALAFSAGALADDAASLKQKLGQLDGMSADFQQTVTDVNDKQIQQGQGVIALASPNRLYWHLTSPDESMIVADGKDVWIYNPFAEEVTVLGIDEVIAASPIALLVQQDDKVWQDYGVTKAGDCYQIKPKSLDSQVVGVDVCFKGDTLSQFSILDSQGNNSLFKLRGQRALDARDDTLFKFTVPENVDIDDQRTGE